MKQKIGIVTINDNNNYGNRLQNYAVQVFLEKNNCKVKTIKNIPNTNNKDKNKIQYNKKRIKNCLHDVKIRLKNIVKPDKRRKKFIEFNKNIKFTKTVFNINNKHIWKEYSYFIAGSDQIWNPKFGGLSDFDLLSFAKPEQRIAFSASFGIDKLSEEKLKEKAKKELQKFKAISVREDSGKKIVEELTGRKDVQVLVDPTMLLTEQEWDEVARKPEQLKFNKYILNYFLGELSEKRKKEIDRIAKENNCKVINILDKNDPFYQTGPSEFLYLEKNAFLICTDSFHSCIFAILFNRPFIVFDREDSNAKMNSRINTLLNKFDLEDRRFKGKINEEQINIDYTEVYEILKKEKNKIEKFIECAIRYNK